MYLVSDAQHATQQAERSADVVMQVYAQQTIRNRVHMDTQRRGQASYRVWLLLLGVLLIGTYAAMLVPALAGLPQNPSAGSSSLLLHSLFLYVLWKQRARTGWHGALIGAGVGVLAFFVAAFIGGMLRAA